MKTQNDKRIEELSYPRWERFIYLSLLTLLPLTILVYGAVHPIIIAATISLIGLVTVFYLFLVVFNVAKPSGLDSISALFLIVVTYCLVQIVPFGQIEIEGVAIPSTISIDPFWTSVTGVQFLSIGCFFFLIKDRLTDTERIGRTVVALGVFCIFYAFFAILQSIISPGKVYGFYEVVGASPFGSFVNRHNFAAVMEMGIGFPIAFAASGFVDRDKKFLLIMLAVIMGIALLLSGSRGGLVALLVQSLLIGYLVGRGSRSRRSSRLKQFGFAVALMAVVIGGLVFIGGENTLTRVVDTAAQEDFTTSRLAIWGVTLDVIWKHLPFGAGFGAFQTAYTEFDPSSGVQRVAQAHNDYLQVLADGGVVGLAFGIGFLVLVWRRSVKALSIKDRTLRSIAVGAVSGIVAVLVHSLFDFVLHTMAVALMFTLLLAIVQAIEISRERIAEENESQESKSISVFPITRSS